jgi:imidazole glycerol-phosphate synthase subunit HisF
MLKKRVIFTLLFNGGNYMLSRNFQLQQVGDLNWLKENYVFSKISFSIDELIVLNVSRNNKNKDLFKEHIKELTRECFIPIAAGGGIRNIDEARQLLSSGADKITINTPLFTNPDLIHSIAKEFGEQCIVASVDIKRGPTKYNIYIENGERILESSLEKSLHELADLPIGELYLNSINRDGTGQGFDDQLLNFLPDDFPVPVIISGGAGNYKHLISGLESKKTEAVATAHLFNFVGSGLENARKKILERGFDLPIWDNELMLKLKQ